MFVLIYLSNVLSALTWTFDSKNTGESLEILRGYHTTRGQEGPSSTQPAHNQAQNPPHLGGRIPAWGLAPVNNDTWTPTPNDGSRTVNPYTDGSRTSYGVVSAPFLPHLIQLLF